MQSSLGLRAPLPTRLLAWAHERFPLPTGIGFFVGYGVAALFARAIVVPGPVTIGASDLLMFPAIWSFFLLLRVLDEHKDYEIDVRNHPQRVLQSGLITLGHLRGLAIASVLLQIVSCVWKDGGFGPITKTWLAALAFAGLMAKEFFATRWIGHRLVVYAFLHMLIMPFIYTWMAQIGAGAAALPWQTASVAAAAFFGGFAFEVARKTKAPNDERATVDSYTQRLGIAGAATTSALSFAAMGAATMAAIALVAPNAWIAQGLVILFSALPALAAVSFARKPTTKNAKVVEGATGGGILLVFLVLLVIIAVRRGIAWQ